MTSLMLGFRFAVQTEFSTSIADCDFNFINLTIE